MDERMFTAGVFKTFDLNLSTLPSRIAFQKTVFILKHLNLDVGFDFIWHNFGPYSSNLAKVGFSIDANEIENAQILTGKPIQEFMKLKKDYEKDSRFLEMTADIIFIAKNNKTTNKDDMFKEISEHRSYLNDKPLFELIFDRLSQFNLI